MPTHIAYHIGGQRFSGPPYAWTSVQVLANGPPSTRSGGPFGVFER